MMVDKHKEEEKKEIERILNSKEWKEWLGIVGEGIRKKRKDNMLDSSKEVREA